MQRILLIGLLLVLWAMPAQAAVLPGFPVEWESKPGAPWDYTSPRPEIDCTVPPSPSGGCALKFNYLGGTYPTSTGVGGRAGNYNLGAEYTELWIGHWNRYSLNFVWNPNGTKMDFIILSAKNISTDGAIPNMAVGWKGSSTAPTSVASNQILFNPQTQDFWSSYTAVKNTWFWIEHHLVINTPGQSNGLYEMYVNNVRVNRQPNVPYRGPNQAGVGWRSLVHTAEWGGGGGTFPTMQWWVDHTVVSTTQIGMPGGIIQGDTTPPAPVQNFRVQ